MCWGLMTSYHNTSPRKHKCQCFALKKCSGGNSAPMYDILCKRQRWTGEVPSVEQSKHEWACTSTNIITTGMPVHKIWTPQKLQAWSVVTTLLKLCCYIKITMVPVLNWWCLLIGDFVSPGRSYCSPSLYSLHTSVDEDQQEIGGQLRLRKWLTESTTLINTHLRNNICCNSENDFILRPLSVSCL